MVIKDKLNQSLGQSSKNVYCAFIMMLQKPDLAGLAEFLKPLNEEIMKANAMTEGKRSDFFNHLKGAADSLSALAWIAYTGKDCGKRESTNIIIIDAKNMLFSED